MSILDNAKAHFKALEPGEIDVPEWNTKLTWKPLTLADENKIYADDRVSGLSATTEQIFVRALIFNALGEDGKPAFSDMDENQLSHGVDPASIKRIASAILNTSSQSGNITKKVDAENNA